MESLRLGLVRNVDPASVFLCFLLHIRDFYVRDCRSESLQTATGFSPQNSTV